MTNSDMLGDEISKSGMEIAFIAAKLGISKNEFHKKMNNETEFNASEIIILQSVLKLSNNIRDEIFFAQNVE